MADILHARFVCAFWPISAEHLCSLPLVACLIRRHSSSTLHVLWAKTASMKSWHEFKARDVLALESMPSAILYLTSCLKGSDLATDHPTTHDKCMAVPPPLLACCKGCCVAMGFTCSCIIAACCGCEVCVWQLIAESPAPGVLRLLWSQEGSDLMHCFPFWRVPFIGRMPSPPLHALLFGARVILIQLDPLLG